MRPKNPFKKKQPKGLSPRGPKQNDHTTNGRPNKGRKPPPSFARGPHRPNPHKPLTPKDGRIIAGVHAVREAFIVRPQAVTQLWIKSGADLNADPIQTVASSAKKANLEIQFKSSQQLDQICASHQGVVAVVSESPSFNGINEGECYIILDQIEDPHNLGAMLRTGWLLGASAFFIPDHHSVGLTPTVHKVATGACEHVPVVKVSSIKKLIGDLKKANFQVFGLSGAGRAQLFKTTFPESVALIIGSESDGLRKHTEESCDHLLSIHQSIRDASYNASVACAMVLSEWKRQRLARSLAST